jgi:microcystin-dependent protein
MPEMPDQIMNEIIPSEWGNDIRDRTVQRYDNVSTRSAENPTPAGGDLAYMEDTGDVLVFHGATWKALMPTGVVVPFAAGVAPPGWLLCQGQAVSRTTYPALFAVIGTTFGAGDGSTTFNLPQLRQRFPMGVATSGTGSTLGATGGTVDGAAHTHGATGLTTSSTGSHDHPAATGSAGAHTHDVNPPEWTTASAGSHAHTFSDTTSAAATTSATYAVSPTQTVADSHSHSVSGTTSSTGSHTHDFNLGIITSGSAGSHTHATDTDSAGTHSHTVSGSTAAGGTGAAENPPFIALHYIIKA